MIRRALLFTIAFAFGVGIIDSLADQAKGVRTVGILALSASPTDPIVGALRQELHNLGYVEGRSIKFEFRTAQGHPNRLPRLAEELIQLKVDVIVVGNSVVAQAVRQATATIPIVMVTTDPVASDLVTSLAHPAGNITGLSAMTKELTAKRLELLKETVPTLVRVAVLWNPDSPMEAQIAEEIKAAARPLSLELHFVGLRTREEISAASSAISRAHAKAMYVTDDGLFYGQRTTVGALASKARLPAIYGSRLDAEDGGLISYGVDYVDQWRRSAAYVDRILKGAKPGDLPIEQATTIELVVNLKTARALGISIPTSILERANKLIE